MAASGGPSVALITHPKRRKPIIGTAKGIHASQLVRKRRFAAAPRSRPRRRALWTTPSSAQPANQVQG